MLEAGTDFGVYVTMDPFQRMLNLFDSDLAASNNKVQITPPWPALSHPKPP